MRYLSLLLLFCSFAVVAQAGEIVPGLDDSAAKYTSTSPTNGVAGNISDITNGIITYAARFSPDASQAQAGPVLIIEDGGTSNGSGLYMIEGYVVLCGKSYAHPGVTAASLDDRDFSDFVIAARIGKVEFGVENKVFASLNVATGKLIGGVNNKFVEYDIPGCDMGINFDGNLSVAFMGIAESIAVDLNNKGWNGGLTDGGTNPLLNRDNCQAMTLSAGYDNLLGQIFDQAPDLSVLPSNPEPADLVINVDPEAVTQLKFDASPEANVTGHWVRFYSTFEGEPNFAIAPTVSEFIPAGANPLTCPVSFELDDVICWQVEEQISGSAQGDDANILGPIWTFSAALSVPNITASPAKSLVYDYTSERYQGAATFTCEFFAKTPPTSIRWYRGTDTSNPVSDGATDITVELSQDGYNYTSTLFIDNPELADEDSYWCKVENTAGSDSSDSAMLVIKRNVAHWTLDTADMVGGQYADISGAGHNADPNYIPAGGAVVDGVDAAVTGQGIDFTIDPQNNVAISAGWDPATESGEFTVSGWINDYGYTGGYQGIITKRENDRGVTSWYWEIRPAGFIAFGNDTGDVALDFNPYMNQWTLVTVTASDEGFKLYINGALAVSNANRTPTPNDAFMIIGANNSNSGVFAGPFNGAMDDMRIYNYALSDGEVAMLYYDVLNTPVCIDPNGIAMRFDTNDNCVVDIADFVVFAADWLNDNLCPGQGCE
ncbi:MAG: LamG-like jellyroll fold domain-containing protein [Phycisphaerae bacterium]